MNQENRRYRMLHLTVNPANPVWPKKAVELQLSKHSDWIRYAENSWLFWTDKSAQEWHHIFRELTPALRQHQYLLLAIDVSERQGWMPQAVWDWINQYAELYRNALLELLTESSGPKRRTLDPLAEILGVPEDAPRPARRSLLEQLGMNPKQNKP